MTVVMLLDWIKYLMVFRSMVMCFSCVPCIVLITTFDILCAFINSLLIFNKLANNQVMHEAHDGIISDRNHSPLRVKRLCKICSMML